MRQKASDTDADLDEQILLLAVPALLSLLLDPLLTAADTAFVGKSEETLFTEAHRSVFMKVKGENSGLAALAVSSSVFNFISYSGSFLAQATTPLVSREVALEEAKRKNRKNDDENDENIQVLEHHQVDANRGLSEKTNAIDKLRLRFGANEMPEEKQIQITLAWVMVVNRPL